ncbi:hypothetical protein [Budvicia aquatica]|uniref:Uncharacterized protein n=1 Tax=Budvicia aquatica TaxID=82979 RepID=A0A2C6DG16_9GAMM|nr:hypothetical protein [Budvicia aquatica]PHI29228.1 hypothetical protein CRN84_07795 [Budvicia aquatica]VFS47438.1 Uncharacterised protein [Budvicia aquatica]
MEHRYTRDSSRPDYDGKITEWLKENDEEVDMMPYPVAIYHDGFIYRSITGGGLGDYVEISEFLSALGLVNIIAPDATFRGYDAVFAIPAIKAAIEKGELNIQDIPKNAPKNE